MKIRLIPLSILVAGTALAGAAAAAGTLPPEQKNDGVAYISGGIGQAQAQAMKEASPHWPLTMVFAARAGEHSDYLANVHVSVRDGHGRVAFETTADGPLLLARLAPGRYKVDATIEGRTLVREVEVAAGHPTRALFLWPAGTDAGAA